MTPETLYVAMQTFFPSFKDARADFLVSWAGVVDHADEKAVMALLKGWKRTHDFAPSLAQFRGLVGTPPKRQEALPCFGQCGATLAGPVALAQHERACPKAQEAQARGQAHAGRVLAKLRRKWAAKVPQKPEVSRG